MEIWQYIFWGIFAVILLVVVIAVIVAVVKIKSKVRDVSRLAFGTDSFLEGYKKQEEELSNTERSLNGMTKILLPSITRDFPPFNYQQAKSRAEFLVRAYLNTLESGRLSELKSQQVSQTICDKAETIINDLASTNKRVFYDDIVIHRTEISDYKKRDGMCTVTFQSAVAFLNYYLDENGKVVGGSRELKRQTVFETDYTYVQDPDKIKESGNYTSISLSCPNCGAPIKNLGAKFCEYCGTGVKEINIYSWNFTDIRDVDKTTKKYF